MGSSALRPTGPSNRSCCLGEGAFAMTLGLGGLKSPEDTTFSEARGTRGNPIPRAEYEVGIAWLADRAGLSRHKVRSMLDIVPDDWPRLDAAMSALTDYLEGSAQMRIAQRMSNYEYVLSR